ncbi:MAG: type II secretion system protein [Verrucomicrobia bacterium]|nr:type II secretion system protein [Verrucomicrobiota bacterium]
MNRARPSQRPRGEREAFSLIEMVGVLAVISVLVAVVGPNFIRKIVDNVSIKEGKSLETLAQGLRQSLRNTQTIPGGVTWSASVATATGLNPAEVLYADPNNPATSQRIMVIDPRFSPSTGADPVFTPTSAGALAPTNARVMLVSSTKRGLALPIAGGKAANTAANCALFDNVWNWTLNPFTKLPPTGWPAAWDGQGEHLHVQRVNLADEFYRVTVSNSNFPTNIPFGKFNLASTYPFDVTNAVDSYYVRGTTIRLYRHDTPYVSVPVNPDELCISHTLKSDVNFIYDGNPPRWRIP